MRDDWHSSLPSRSAWRAAYARPGPGLDSPGDDLQSEAQDARSVKRCEEGRKGRDGEPSGQRIANWWEKPIKTDERPVQASNLALGALSLPLALAHADV